MIIEQLPNHLQTVVDSNPLMKRYLRSLNQSKSTTPRSWLFDGQHGNPFAMPDDVRDKWVRRLSILGTATSFEQNVLAFDLAQLEKWGPQGGHPPIHEVLDSTVLPTFRRAAEAPTSYDAFDDPDWIEAKDRVGKVLRVYARNLSPLAARDVASDLVNEHSERLSSNSGFPDFSKRKQPDVLARAVEDAESGAYREYPAMLLFRYYNGKLRMVWMYPFAANINEARYFYPLQQRLATGRITFFTPWAGFESVKQLVSNVYNHDTNNNIAASDFSATDEHFTEATTMQVADVLEKCFKPEYRDGLRDSLKEMHNIPLLIGPSKYVCGTHGVSSGSQWTNFVETVFDMILSTYATIKSKGKVTGLYGIGDDMAWLVDKSMHPETFTQWLEDLGHSVGQEIKAEKTMLIPGRVKTLQRLFQAEYYMDHPFGQGPDLRGVYPTVRALKSLLYPERWHKSQDWDYDMFAVRTIMILENCVDHPLFDEFVSFVASGSPRLVAWAKQRDSAILSKQELAKHVPGLVVSYNQEKENQKLTDFVSINVLRRL